MRLSGEPSVSPLLPAVWALGTEGSAGVRSLQALRDPGTHLLTALPCVLDCPPQDPVQLETSRWVSQAVGLNCGHLCSSHGGGRGQEEVALSQRSCGARFPGH